MDENGDLTTSFKLSKAGRLKLIKMDDHYLTTDIYSNDYKDELETVFENGKVTKEYAFEEIRDRAKIKTLQLA